MDKKNQSKGDERKGGQQKPSTPSKNPAHKSK